MLNHMENPHMIQSTSPQPAKPERLLRLPAVESLTGLKKSSIYAGMSADPPTFPRCVRLSARAVAWRESDIAAWQYERQLSVVATHPAHRQQVGGR